MTGVTVHEADREKHLVGLDIPTNIWKDAETEAGKAGRWIYEVLVDWIVLGHRQAKVKADHVRSKKVKA